MKPQLFLLFECVVDADIIQAIGFMIRGVAIKQAESDDVTVDIINTMN